MTVNENTELETLETSPTLFTAIHKWAVTCNLLFEMQCNA